MNAWEEVTLLTGLLAKALVQLHVLETLNELISRSRMHKRLDGGRLLREKLTAVKSLMVGLFIRIVGAPLAFVAFTFVALIFDTCAFRKLFNIYIICFIT